jgi:catechol 2,3-dioxygenase-like lactoylglutathione lyase family enzyme
VRDNAGVERVGQIAIRVRDLDRAIPFYRDVLGLPFLFRTGNLAFLDCGGIRILLDIPEDSEFDHPSSIIYFSVSDIRESFGALRRQGVVTVNDPHIIATLQDREIWMAFFRDPDGNVLALMSEVPAGSAEERA